MNLFVFGMGNSGRAIARRLKPRVETVWGTTRSQQKADALKALGVEPILFDGSPGPDLEEALKGATHVVVSTPPSATGDPVLAQCKQLLAAHPPTSLVYLSTVGVYGNYDGAWIDESNERRPVSDRAHRRVAAEDAWREFHDQTGAPVAILRLAGIYGGGPKPFDKILDGTSRRIVKKDQVFNRIHVDDIANIADAIFAHQADGIFNGTDDEPAPPQDVITYAAGLLGVEPPPEVTFEEADLSPMGRSFYSDNKRIRNDKIKRDLGVKLIYPTYREGLNAMVKPYLTKTT